MAVPPERSDTHGVLTALSDNVLRLLAGFPSAPQALRIRVGEVTLEAEWPLAAESTASGHAGPRADSRSEKTLANLDIDPATRHAVAPMVGVFYRAPEPGAASFVEAGSTVKAGDQVGIVEAMKLMVPVRVDDDGTVLEFLKENGESVEYGEPLITYKIV